jgi:hypothetical protein
VTCCAAKVKFFPPFSAFFGGSLLFNGRLPQPPGLRAARHSPNAPRPTVASIDEAGVAEAIHHNAFHAFDSFDSFSFHLHILRPQPGGYKKSDGTKPNYLLFSKNGIF